MRAVTLPLDIVSIVGNHPTLSDLAVFYGKPFHHIPVSADTKADAEATFLALVADLDAELVVLARYMQILSPQLSEALRGKAINIHHPLLPSFEGART